MAEEVWEVLMGRRRAWYWLRFWNYMVVIVVQQYEYAEDENILTND